MKTNNPPAALACRLPALPPNRFWRVLFDSDFDQGDYVEIQLRQENPLFLGSRRIERRRVWVKHSYVIPEHIINAARLLLEMSNNKESEELSMRLKIKALQGDYPPKRL